MRRSLWLVLAVCLTSIGCSQSADDVETAETFVTVHRPPEPNELPREDAAAGWIKLFDGETLFGWRPPAGDWRVEAGALVSDGAAPAILTTTTAFADYELRWEAWAGDAAEGALALRTSSDPATAGQTGFQLQFGSRADAATSAAEATDVTFGRLPAAMPQEWTQHTAVVEGGELKVLSTASGDAPVLNGTFPDGAVAGAVSLVAGTGPVKIRNLYLKPLGTTPLFNGQDLSGWHLVPGGTAEFMAIVREKESRLYLYRGDGYLETDEQFENFVLQAEISFNGQGFDSGIILRSPTGTEAAPANGYEVQLNNETRTDDRSQPLDHGTGGLYGLVPAREQVAQNFFWFVPTIVAHGNHIAVWIDGQQVTDFTDTRPPSDNASEGSRTAAGHLSLQAHGEKPDIYFNTINIARLPSAGDAGAPAASDTPAPSNGG